MTQINPTELSPNELRFTCDEAQFDFASTADVPSLSETMAGQDRALRAVNFGVSMPNKGYNIYAMGPPGTGKISFITEFLRGRAREMPQPDDWCYVMNFANPDQPHYLKLPPGAGTAFQKDMEALIEELRQDIPRALESEDYENERNRIMQEMQRKQNAQFSQLDQTAQEKGFVIQRGQLGVFFVPLIDGKPATAPEQVAQLSLEQRNEIDRGAEQLQTELNQTMRAIQAIVKEGRGQLAELERNIAMSAIGPHIEELKEKYAPHAPVVRYLEDMQRDIIEHLKAFHTNKEGEQQGPIPFGGLQPEISFDRYKVNLIVDHSQTEGAPIEIVNNPTYQNLIGRVERQAQFGTLITDFTLIKAGAFHRANGGYLVVEASHLLRQPFAYEVLKRTLHTGSIRITDFGQEYSLISTVSVEPEPIPLDVKVVVIGNPMYYYLLQAYDEEFGELFKVQADFDGVMERTTENIASYVQFLKAKCDDEDLKHFAPSGVARLIEYGTELTGDQEKLSTLFTELCNLAREASFYAEQNGDSEVTRDEVQKAIIEKIYRANRIEQRLAEMIEKGQVFISTEGAVVGQVNGLSVVGLGGYSFGKPSRITARTYMGSSGVVSIEREVRTSGPIHNKGVMTLTGYINGKYGQDKPISMSAQLSFEQLYEGVEGDSASSTELYALLSSLSGYPIQQGFAVTGSVNQHGEIQPIGGVTEKVTGFYEVCKAFGFTGNQGVLIPKSNVKNLTLKTEIVESVSEGKFHIYPVDTIDRGIEILTGKPSGERDDDGNYPEDTINWAVEKRLNKFAKGLKRFRSEQEKPAEESDNAEEEINTPEPPKEDAGILRKVFFSWSRERRGT